MIYYVLSCSLLLLISETYQTKFHYMTTMTKCLQPVQGPRGLQEIRADNA